MPVVFGHKLRWVEDEADCTVCGKEYDGSWMMVKNFTTGDLYCKSCLAVWRVVAEEAYEKIVKHFSTHRPME